MQGKQQVFLFIENSVNLEGNYYQLPAQHGIWMSSENLWVDNKTCAVYNKCHFLWRLRVNVTAKAHSAISKSLWSNEGFMVPFIPTLEARAFDIFGKWHHVRERKICWLRGRVKWKVWKITGYKQTKITWQPAKSLGRKINLVPFKTTRTKNIKQKNPQTLGIQRQKLLSRAHKEKTN